MSGANSGNPTQVGSLETAAADIGKILAREGNQGPAPRREPPRPDPAPRGTEREPPAEPEPDETLPEAEDETEEVDTEAEDDAGDDEAPDDEEGDEEQQPRERMVTVKLPDGTTGKVPESELANSFLRVRDYTQKTMALSEERKSFEVERQQVQTERAQYAQLLPALVEQYQQLASPPIDWDRLYQENPAEYVRQQAIRRDLQERTEAAKQEGLRLFHLAQAEEQKNHAALLRRERQLLGEAVPAWKDDAVWNKARAAAREYARELGYTDEQIGGVTDHRAVMVLWQAGQYAAMLKRGRAVPLPPSSTRTAPEPGTNTVRRRTSEMTRAKQRLAKTHSVRDAAAVIRGLL
jgi:uncharacterized membrane-anchored protein YhcB (DUF1043 family)